MRAIALYSTPGGLFNLFDDFDFFRDDFSKGFIFSEVFEEGRNSYTIEIHLPNVKRKDLRLSINGDRLVLEANDKFGQWGYYSKVYRKSFSLTDDMDLDRLKAKFKRGVLHVEIPKRKELLRRKSIKIEGTEPVNEIIKVRAGLKEIIERLKDKVYSFFSKKRDFRN